MEAKDKVLALNVRLETMDSSAHPACVELYERRCGARLRLRRILVSSDRAVLGAIAKTAKNGHAAPKGIEGQLVTRIAMTELLPRASATNPTRATLAAVSVE